MNAGNFIRKVKNGCPWTMERAYSIDLIKVICFMAEQQTVSYLKIAQTLESQGTVNICVLLH
jgi:hypothetical protein